MKVVILCGGKGTRLYEETEYRPKPMVPVGGRPILWHIMKRYAHYGYSDFVLCLGYKGDMIKDYFRNYRWHAGDISLRVGDPDSVAFLKDNEESAWSVVLAETGKESMTAHRILQIKQYVGNEDTFLLTYGDGLGDIDINAAVDFHKKQGKLCTITGVHPPGRFGELGIRADSVVTEFNEKPQSSEGYINGGYMVCSREVFDYLPDDPSVMFEHSPMKKLVSDGQVAVYRHSGFWQPMDTLAEHRYLNRLWDEGKAPWFADL